MPSALETVQDYITDVRVLLQDQVSPFRYDDSSLLTSFNVMLMEARRLRPDLFVYRYHDKVPFFQEVDASVVHLEQAFRLAVVYGTTSHAMSRDQEDIQDSRASSFMQVFNTILLGLGVPAIGQAARAGGR